jgi:hypothetical protein
MRPGPYRPSTFTEAVKWFVLCCILCALAACVLLSGCRRAETPPAATPASSPAAADAAKLPDIAGSYTLVSINGTPLPFTVTHEGPGIQVTSGTFTIRPDGTCATVTAFVMPSGQAQSREVSATYTWDGSKLTMQWQGAGVTNGTIEGDSFTMDNEGQLFLYRKTLMSDN